MLRAIYLVLLATAPLLAAADLTQLEAGDVQSFTEALDVVVFGVYEEGSASIEGFKDVAERNPHLRFGYTTAPGFTDTFADGAAKGQTEAVYIVREKGAEKVLCPYEVSNADQLDLWIMHKWMWGVTKVTLENSRGVFTSFTGKERFVMLISEGTPVTDEQKAAFRDVAARYNDVQINSHIPKFLYIQRTEIPRSEEMEKEGNKLFNGIIQKFMSNTKLRPEFPFVGYFDAKSTNQIAVEVYEGDMADGAAMHTWLKEHAKEPPITEEAEEVQKIEL